MQKEYSNNVGNINIQITKFIDKQKHLETEQWTQYFIRVSQFHFFFSANKNNPTTAKASCCQGTHRLKTCNKHRRS